MNEEMKQDLYQSVQYIAETYLSAYQNVSAQKAVTVADKDVIRRLRNKSFPKEGRPLRNVIEEMTEDVYTNQAVMQHPRFFAFVPSPATPISWLADVMTYSYNPHAGSWLQSSGASCIEQEVIRWLCRQAGYPESAGGLFVSGGSMSNLTALITARNVQLSEDEYSIGTAYLSGQTHSCVARGLRIMGLRTDQMKHIPADENYRMDITCLEQEIIKDKASGKKPFVVIATAGTTNTGSVDPLHEIADLCEKHNMWMHVDGAYGGSILVSPKYRHILDGISRADSITWDAHKWLFQTYGCSMVLLKKEQYLVNCFSTHPEYLKDAVIENDQTNYWDWGPELTRPARSLKLWFTIQTLGTQKLSQMVEHGVQTAEWFEQELRNHQDWEIVTSAQLAIVNFRYAPDSFSAERLNKMNEIISQKMVSNGFACILTTHLKDLTVLRICAIHPDTTKDDIEKTIRLLIHYADESKMEVKEQKQG